MAILAIPADRIAVMEAHRQRIIGLAIVVLLILLFVIVRHLWSAD